MGPTITLCVFTWNEAGWLGACLDSARPVVDEIIVVDRGSSDGTRAVAHAAGARVLEVPYCARSARAHNLARACAGGDWILSLEATEVLEPQTAPEVRTLASAAEHDGYFVEVRLYRYVPTLPRWRPVDACRPLSRGAVGFLATRSVRLFRRRPRLRTGVEPSSRTRRGGIGDSGLAVHHYGLLRPARARRERLEPPRGGAGARLQSVDAWIDRGATWLDAGQPRRALQAFAKARLAVATPLVSFLKGRAYAALGQWQAALHHLRAAAKANPRDELPGFDNADAFTLIGLVHDERGERRAAEEAYRSAVRSRESPVAINNLAVLLGERGAGREAKRWLERLWPRYRGLAIPWATLGTLHLRTGDLAGAKSALQVALEIDPQNPPARFNLALVYEHAGRISAARRAYAAAGELAQAERTLGPSVRSATRRPCSAFRPLGAGSVVSLVPHLAGGGGRVLVDVISALPGRSHLVLCGAADEYLGIDLRRELDAAGVEIATLHSKRQVRRIVERTRPAVVIQHWWPNPLFEHAARSGDERWVLYAHSASPVPSGFDAYVVLSEFQAQLQSHLPGALVYRIPNSVDRRRFRWRAHSASGRVTVAMTSRLDSEKFPRRLLHHLPPLGRLGARLLIAGRGARRYEIEPELRAHGYDGVVRFVGPLPSARIPEFLEHADIGLHLTETAEDSCSVSVLEMLAAGLPVVAEPKGSLPEMVVSGRNGFLAVGEGAVAHRLQQLIVSPVLRRRMGAASLRRARAFDRPAFRRRVQALVDHLTAKA